MKRLLSTYILLLFLVCYSVQIKAFDKNDNRTFKYEKALYSLGEMTSKKSSNAAYRQFENSARKHKIAHRKLVGLMGVSQGYYAIAGVFGNRQNALKTVSRLKKKGFKASLIKNPKNKLNYVSLKHASDWRELVEDYTTKFDGTYSEKVWILYIQNSNKPTARTSSKIIKKHPQKTKKVPSTIALFENDSLIKWAKRNKIANRTLFNIKDVDQGHYIISGVYSNHQKAKKSVKKLERKGFDSGLIQNPENDNFYVYLLKTSEWRTAIKACTSQFEGKYKDPIWILNVKKGNLQEPDSIPVEAVTLNTINEISKEGQQNEIQSRPTLNKSKLIERADGYFDKMWYAKAAELYEQALGKGVQNYSYEVVQKAGDAHYFNTNMERAYHWYNILYDKYGKEMSSDNIFKYAHSLKGTGKYGRAKKLMRLYNKKLKDGEIKRNYAPNVSTPHEVVLDRLLGAEKNFDIKNMAINSEYSDFSPMFLETDKIVFASAMDSSFLTTRRYKWNDQPYLDLYVAKMNEESQDLKDAVKFSKKINTKYHEAAVTFSPDNNTMYFTRNNYGKKLKRDKKGINHLKIYRSRKIDGEWTEAMEVPFNSDNYSTGHPALSPDGKKLYFVSDMPGSIGETDIFVVDVLDEGRFSEPRNLGPSINTERKEMFPFINNKKMYFSSNGHTGLGGLDVYEVSFDEENGFQEVINVGKPVNSNKDDFSYIVNEETQKGFFASNRAGGKGDDDIYSFKRLVVEEVPTIKNAIAGVVTELITGDIVPQALVELLDENGIKLKELVTDDNGSFVFEDLESDTKYTLKTTKDEFFDALNDVTTLDNDTVSVDVSMRRLKEMIAVEDGIRKLKTEMIHFNFDKHYIRKDAAKELDKLVEVMNEYPEMIIKIESHTDSRGTRAYNRYLSDKRAKSTREYIISKGIDPSRIESAIGYGEDRLLNECNGKVRCSEAKHYLNRRSEFIIVKM